MVSTNTRSSAVNGSPPQVHQAVAGDAKAAKAPKAAIAAIVGLIDGYRQELQDLHGACIADACRYRERKRTWLQANRWLGLLVILLGALIAAMPAAEIIPQGLRVQIVQYLALANVFVGIGVAFMDKYLDPEKARKRSRDLQSLAGRIKSAQDAKRAELWIVKFGPNADNPEAYGALRAEYRITVEELRKEALNLGVDSDTTHCSGEVR